MGLGMVQWVADAEIRQVLKNVEGYTPFAGFGDARDAECVCGVDVDR